MFSGWVRRFGATLALAGLLAVTTGMFWPAPPDELATASAEGAEERVESPPSWRDAVMVAGGICLVAGVGLVVLAIFPDSARRDGRSR